jgi:FKBP-type peptidyl-prolyl cis-trans isomerase
VKRLWLCWLVTLAGCSTAPGEVTGTPPPGATTTASGLAFEVLKPGAGNARPARQEKVRVEYLGWSTKGPFDSSKKSGGTEVFAVSGVVAGWTEALLDMRVGERRRLWLPDKLAYPNLRANPTTWVFEVELLEILRGKPAVAAAPGATPRAPTPPPAAAPGATPRAPTPPPAAAPGDAEETADGLAYRMEKRGAGGAKPTWNDRVVVTYSAWTSDGTLFDSSTLRGKPASLPVRALIPGWAEGLQLMAKGDKAIFWIPEKLAYAGSDAAPRGTLVYEVELHDIIAPR